MKRAVSISIGSSKRDKAVEVTLLGEKISIERIGTDGDMEAAALKYKELDGTVDAFGVGGADLGALADGKWYPLHSVTPMVRYVKKTPLVDGGGLKNTLENRAPAFLDKKIGDYINSHGRKVLVTVGVDRWGLSQAFADAGYETVFGDLMFGLDIPIAIHSISRLKTVAALLMPVAGRLPFSWIYPTGEKQEKRTPKWGKYYADATVIAGDCHYIKRFMPDDLKGKVIVTNTTTPEDVAEFKKAGVKYLVTTTPVLEGRSFGTNMMEAAVVAVAGKGRPLLPELTEMIDKLGFEPQLQELTLTMDAIVTAGGIPQPGDPLYAYSNGDSKALIDIAGKPMIQWILDALGESKKVNNVIVIGLTAKSGLTCKKPLHYISNQGRMLANIVAGVNKSIQLNKKNEYVLLVSSDIPALKPAMVDWLVSTAMKTKDDLYYGVCPREVMEARYPTSHRTYTKLKDMEVCGADMNIIHVSMVTDHLDTWEALIGNRKSPLRQAAVIGWDTLYQLFMRQFTLQGLVERASQRIGIKGRAIIWAQAEPCMDIDKPNQLELMREDFISQKRKVASAQKKSLAVKKKVKPKTVKKTAPQRIKAKVKAKRK